MKNNLLISTFALAISIMSFTESIYAGEKSDTLEAYVKIQEALVADDLGAVKKASQKLQAKVNKESSKFKTELKELLGAKTIKDARNEFKDVSSIITTKYKNEIGDEYIIAYCPMAGAKWIQRKGEIANPYMSKDMQECGEKI